MKIVIHSSPSTIKEEAVSSLAVIETVVSVILMFSISCFYSISSLLFVILFSSLILLLTGEKKSFLSIAYMMKASARFSRFRGNYGDSYFIPIFLGLFRNWVVVISLCFSQLYLAIAYLVKHPLRSLQEMPINWYRAALCIDAKSQPEGVPGLESKMLLLREYHSEHPEKFKDFSIDEAVKHARSRLNFGEMARDNYDLIRSSQNRPLIYRCKYPNPKNDRAVQRFRCTFIPYYQGSIVIKSKLILFMMYTYLFLYCFPLLILYFVTFVLLFSVKASTAVYSPFLWIVHSTFKATIPLKFKLYEMSRTSLAKSVFVYSVAIVVVFVAKISILFNLESFTPLINSLSLLFGAELVDKILAPKDLPLWHVLGCFNAVLSIAVFFYSDILVNRLEWNLVDSEQKLSDYINVLNLIRRTISLYTILCAVLIICYFSWGINWGSISFLFFPVFKGN